MNDGQNGQLRRVLENQLQMAMQLLGLTQRVHALERERATAPAATAAETHETTQWWTPEMLSQIARLAILAVRAAMIAGPYLLLVLGMVRTWLSGLWPIIRAVLGF